MGNRTSSNFLAGLYWITTKIDFLMWDTANKDKNRLRNWNYLGQSLPTCTFSCRRGQKGTKIIWSQLWNGREMVKIIILDRKTVNFIFWYFLLNNGFYSGCNMQDLRSSDNSCAVPTIIIPREKKTSGSPAYIHQRPVLSVSTSCFLLSTGFELAHQYSKYILIFSSKFHFLFALN